MSTPASRRRSIWLIGTPCMRSITITFWVQKSQYISGTSTRSRLCHVAAQLRGVGRLAHQVELVVQVLVELGDHLARLQALAVGRHALDPAAPSCASAPGPSSIAGSMPGRSTLTATSRAVLCSDGEVHLRDRGAGDRLASKLAKIASIGPAERALDRARRATVGRERRHAVLQLGELVGDVGRQQVAPGRQHLAELDEDRAEPLERQAQALAARRVEAAPEVMTRTSRRSQRRWKLDERELVEPVAQDHPEDEDARTTGSCAACPGAAAARRGDRRRGRARRSTNWRSASAMHARDRADRVGRRVADEARQVLLDVPAHVVHQPVHLGGELHVAGDAHRRLVAAQRRLASVNGDSSVSVSVRSGAAARARGRAGRPASRPGAR